MGQACRNRLTQCLDSQAVAHAGLLLHRYLTEGAGDKEHPKARERLFSRARQATELATRQGLYGAAFSRRNKWAHLLSCSTAFELRTAPQQRLIVGLGGESPLEVGLTLHHIYGVPIIPGSALKGLAAHYCETKLHGAGHPVFFGTAESAGYIRFHDAWIKPDCLRPENKDEGLLDDVMTPHHGDYYSGAKYDGTEELIPPTDFDVPVPIRYLSVRGTFHFLLTCEDPSDEEWLRRARALLTLALADWGVGGKTSSGYGRLVEPATVAQPTGAPAQRGKPLASASSPSSARTVTGSASAFPASGTFVEVVVLTDKTLKGKLKVRHLVSGMEGTITNSPDVPASLVEAGKLTVMVTASTRTNANFRYESDPSRAALEAKKRSNTRLTSRRPRR